MSQHAGKVEEVGGLCTTSRHKLAVLVWIRRSTSLVVLAPGVIPRTPPGELPFRWHARHGNRARNRAGGREREPEAATDVGAAWGRC